MARVINNVLNKHRNDRRAFKTTKLFCECDVDTTVGVLKISAMLVILQWPLEQKARMA
jgi:hypothetical protein